MSIAITGKQITDGLIFAYDTFNVKSYVGEPTTNCFYTPTPDASGNTSFSVQGNGTFIRILSGSYGGYEIMPNDVVYRYDLGSAGCHYHGNDYNIPAGNYVTFTFDYFVNATGYPDTNYLGNIENGGNGLGAAFTDPTPSIQGVWKTWSYSPPSTSTGTGFSRFLLYPGGCGGKLATGGYILYKNPRAEFNKQHATPFVISGPSSVGIRSNTQGLLDLAAGNSINLANTTFNSSGNISFGQGAVITTSMLNVRPLSQITQECWFSPTINTAQVFIGAQYGSSSDNSYALWMDGANSLAAGVNVNGSFNYSTQAYTITTNKYYHFVHTYDGSTQAMYMNGVLLKTWSTSGGIFYNLNNTLLALANDWNSGYDSGASIGVIGDMPVAKIYNRALSRDEILKNYNASKGRYGR